MLAPLRRVLDQLPHPTLLVTLDGRIAHASPACSDLLGHEAQTLLGRDLGAVLADSDDDLDRLLRLWAGSAQPRPGVLHTGTGQGTSPVHAEGSRIPELDLLLVRCRERGDALDGFDELSREVEARNLRHMKRRMEATIDELRTANRRLEDANDELDRYAAVVSHDLRTPLTTIAGFVDLLHMDHAQDLDEEGLEILHILERNTRRMDAAIDALLQLARTAGPPEYVPPLDPQDVVRDVLEQIGSEIGDARVDVETMPQVAVDRTHLSQVLQNLLVNSVRYRSPDRPLSITVSARPEGNWVEISVSDNGIGIPEEERERVFEPLRRGRHVEDVEGTGIGLATCRKIVRSYGGDIAVVDREEPGATIALTVPAG